MLKIFHNSDFLHNASASLHDRVKMMRKEKGMHMVKCDTKSAKTVHFRPFKLRR